MTASLRPGPPSRSMLHSSHPTEAGEADVDHETQPLERQLLRHIRREVQRARASRRRRQLFQGLQQHGSACQSQPTRPGAAALAMSCACATHRVMVDADHKVRRGAAHRRQPRAASGEGQHLRTTHGPLTLRSAPLVLVRQKVRGKTCAPCRALPRSACRWRPRKHRWTDHPAGNHSAASPPATCTATKALSNPWRAQADQV